MDWFTLAIIAPFLWSIANYLDKYLLSKRTSAVGSGGLLIVSAIMSCIAAWVIYYNIGAEGVHLDSQVAGALVLSGMFEALYIIFYFICLERESTSTVVSLFQFAPIMGLLFGYLLLREMPNMDQLLGVGLVLFGTLLVVKQPGERFSFRKGILPLMIASTAFVGIYNTIFKIAAEGISFWSAMYWQYIGIGIVGLILFFSIRPHRMQTYAMLGKSGMKVLFLTGLAELANIGALMATNSAILLAPIALVLSIGSVQPIIVFVEGILISIFFPRLFKGEEKIRLSLQYIFGILLTCIGGAYIYMH